MKGSTKFDVLDLEAGPSSADMAALQYFLNMNAPAVRGPVYSVTDLGELAARLGSIVTFDRRGDVVWLDDFESGVGKWLPVTSGVGAGVVVSNSYARNGLYSCELTAGTTMAQVATIQRVLPYPVLSRMGFECSFAFDSNLAEIYLTFDMFDGASQHIAEVRYDYVNKKLQYRDSDNNWQDIATSLDLRQSYYPFWVWKLVVDFANEEYVRLVLNETEHKLDGIAYRKTAAGTIASLRPSITNRGAAAANAVVYVDDVIITQNEPENIGCGG